VANLQVRSLNRTIPMRPAERLHHLQEGADSHCHWRRSRLVFETRSCAGARMGAKRFRAGRAAASGRSPETALIAVLACPESVDTAPRATSPAWTARAAVYSFSIRRELRRCQAAGAMDGGRVRWCRAGFGLAHRSGMDLEQCRGRYRVGRGSGRRRRVLHLYCLSR
jgi:hypothetical protein